MMMIMISIDDQFIMLLIYWDEEYTNNNMFKIYEAGSNDVHD